MKKRYQIFLILAGVIVLAGFGCKNSSSEGDQNQDVTNPTDSSTSVTFNTGTTGSTDSTNTATGSTTTTDSNSTNTDTQNNTNDDVSNRPTETNSGDQSGSSAVVEQDLNDLTIKVVEIYGSFTNKSKTPFKNLLDLDVYGTERFKSWSASQRRQTINPQASFYGISTDALSVAPLEMSENNARLLVTTERKEVTETNETRNSFYQLIVVEMVRENNEWKLDGLFWQ